MSKLASLFSRGGSYRCPVCGSKLKNGEMFCPGCGQPRADAQAADAGYAAPNSAQPEYAPDAYAQPVGIVCAACGNPMEEGDIFCMNCGTRREDAPAAPVTADVPMGFEEAAPFMDEAPVFAPEPEPVVEEKIPKHLRASIDEAPVEPRPNTTAAAVFMAANEPEMPAAQEPAPVEEAAVPAPAVSEAEAPAAAVIEESTEPEAPAAPEAPVVMEQVAEPAVAEDIIEETADVSAKNSESNSLFDDIDESSIWGKAAAEPEPVQEAPVYAESAPVQEAHVYAEPAPAQEAPVYAESAPVQEAPVYAEPAAASAAIYSAEPAAAKPAAAPQPAVPQPTMYGLRFLAEPDRDVCILRSGAIIGRLATCSLVIDEPSVSRRHCHIDYANGQWAMVILGVNGIVIDGEHYTNEYGRPVPLTDGCIIEFPGITANTPVQFLANPF